MKNIVIFYSMTFYKYNNEYYCNGAFGKFLEELSKFYDKLYLCVPVKEMDTKPNNYKLNITNLTLQSLSFYGGTEIGALKMRKTLIKEVEKHSVEWEGVVYIRWPSPLSYEVYKLARKKKLKTSIHIVGDPKTLVKEGSKYKGILRMLALIYASYNELYLKRMMKKSANLVNGNAQKHLYFETKMSVKEIRTSTVSNADIYHKEDNMGNPIRLLYVGYIRHEKGLEYLVEALSTLLKNSKNNYELTIIGEGEYEDEIRSVAEKMKVTSNIKFQGFIPLGEDLFRHYRNNDIFIIPSISEGTPRVILEALANGLNVIATNVGGIPFTIVDKWNGLIIPSKSSKAIHDAVLDLVNSKSLRNKLRLNGYEFVGENTIESHVKEVVKYIDEFDDSSIIESNC